MATLDPKPLETRYILRVRRKDGEEYTVGQSRKLRTYDEILEVAERLLELEETVHIDVYSRLARLGEPVEGVVAGPHQSALTQPAAAEALNHPYSVPDLEDVVMYGPD